MARMLHICKNLENGTLSRPSPLCSTSDFTSRTPTIKPRNRCLHTQPEVPKIAFSPSSSYFAFRQTNLTTHELFGPFQSALFITRQVCV